MNATNRDERTVEGFGDEWSRFDQSALSEAELLEIWEHYFAPFPWDKLPPNARGIDIGCGSGRWARFVAPRVGSLICLDASDDALAVARRNLATASNIEFVHASVDSIPVPDGTLDFGYSLGVLHHVPDTQAGITASVAKLKPGAPFLIYLYYAFDNRPAWFRRVWRASEVIRGVVSHLPLPARFVASQVLAGVVYYPLARGARVAEKLGFDVERVPLSAYRDRKFYVMRTDALDRFGTSLEQRFTQDQIRSMMGNAGLGGIYFSDGLPYWTAVGFKKAP